MLQPQALVAAVIGDMIASRQVPDRLGLQREMQKVLDEVDRVVGGSPTFTIGDEFQASYATVGEAIEASMHLHLRAIGLIDLRVGIGWGELISEDLERAPFGQDGPCWWRAREAIERVDRSTRDRGPARRTAIGTETSLDSLLNHYLLLRDTVIAGFDETDARVALGLLEGRSQSDLATEIGVNKSSVSRRVNTHGILAVIEARPIGPLRLGSQP